MKNKIMILILSIILLCGCSKKECIKSHQEEGNCLRTQCIMAGKTITCIPITYYCTENICDEWSK